MSDVTSPTAAERFVRQFALTSGRARSGTADLPLDAIVVTSPAGRAAVAQLRGEQRVLVEQCDRPLAIAELSAHLGLHLGIVRVLVGDLCGAGLLDVAVATHPHDGPDLATLERLLDDLHAL